MKENIILHFFDANQILLVKKCQNNSDNLLTSISLHILGDEGKFYLITGYKK